MVLILFCLQYLRCVLLKNISIGRKTILDFAPKKSNYSRLASRGSSQHTEVMIEAFFSSSSFFWQRMDRCSLRRPLCKGRTKEDRRIGSLKDRSWSWDRLLQVDGSRLPSRASMMEILIRWLTRKRREDQKKVKAGQKNASTVAGVSTFRKICNQLTSNSSVSEKHYRIERYTSTGLHDMNNFLTKFMNTYWVTQKNGIHIF